MAILVPILVFAFVASLGYFLYLTLEERNHTVRDRLTRLARPGKEYSERDRVLEESFFIRTVKPLLAKVSHLTARLTPAEQKEKLRTQLLMAGNPANLQVPDYLAVKGILAVGLPIVGFFLLVGLVPKQAGLIAMALGILGYIGPDFVLRSKVEGRQKEIQKSLPDTLDLLTVSVEAGLGFDSAMAKVGEKMEGPLAQEFGRTLQEMRLGKPRRNALRDLADRNKVDDLSTFVTALVQADQLGVSISKVLRVQSEQMRNKRRQRAEEKAMKAPVKMLFPMILFIFPTIFIILLGPAAIRIMKTFAEM